MKKIAFLQLVLTFLSAIFLFNSCKHNVTTEPEIIEEKPAGTVTVTCDENGLVITTACEAGYDRNSIQVYDVAEGHYNLSVYNLTENEVVYYPFVTAGKTYNIEYTLNTSDGSKGYAKGKGIENYTATSGLGDISLLCTGFNYDGDKTFTLVGNRLILPDNFYDSEFQQKIQNWYYSMNLSDGIKIYVPYTDCTFDSKTGIFIISDNFKDNPEYSNVEFHGNYQFGLTYEDHRFSTQYWTNETFKLGNPAGIYFTQSREISLNTTAAGLYFRKQYNDSYPNVRIKVYNKTKNHYCPTVKLDQYYTTFDYEYVNSGDVYTVELDRWDSNWSNYSYKKIDNVIPTGGKGDLYFEYDSYAYEQGTPDSYDANIVFTSADIAGNSKPDSVTVSGNIYIKEGAKYSSFWKKFNYSYDKTEKNLSIDISSCIKSIRGKTFYAQLAASWYYNNYEYELSLIDNKSNPFTDVHVKSPSKITENYTVLREYGTCNIDKSLQGKKVYLIKYNTNKVTSKDISVYPDVYENEFCRDFEPAIPGKYLGEVSDFYGRAADDVKVTDYAVGTTKQLYGFGNYNNQNESFPYNATLKAKGKHCYVWYANNNSDADKAVNAAIKNKTFSFETLAQKFDDIYDMETALIGPKRLDKVYDNMISVIEEERVNIFAFDLYGDYKKARTENSGIVGYYNGGDLYKKSIRPNSNECELISVDSACAAENPDFMYLTLIHEFQHYLLNLNKGLNKTINNGYSGTWFTEMMSEGAEIALQNKCLGFTDSRAETGRAGSFNTNYNLGFEVWNNSNGAKYSNASIFAAYLMRNYGGAKLWQEIASNNYIGEEAITEALHSLGYSEDFDSVMMKMGQMIVNSYDSTPVSGSLTLNKEVSSQITDASGNKHTLVLNKFDLKKTETYNPSGYSNSDRVTFSTAEALHGPAILKTGASFSELRPKAIGVYKLTDKCGASLELKDPGDGIEMALYFK